MSGSDDIKKEIRELRRVMANFAETSLDKEEERRVENIQVLVALGILGGFITAFVRGLVQGSTFELYFWVITLTSVVFLLGKILIPPIRLRRDPDWLGILDERLLYLHTFGILFGILLIFVSSLSIFVIRLDAIISTIRLPFGDLQTDVSYMAVLGFISGVISFVITFWYLREYRLRSEELRRSEQYIRNTSKKLYEELLVNSVIEYLNLNSIEKEAQIGNARPDIIGRTPQGDTTIIEVKRGSIDDSTVMQLRDYYQSYQSQNPEDTIRGILVGNSLTDKAKELLENYDFTFINEGELEVGTDKSDAF